MGHSPGLNVSTPLKSPLLIGCISKEYDSFLFGKIISFSGPLMNASVEET